jgi:peptide deformylase
MSVGATFGRIAGFRLFRQGTPRHIARMAILKIARMGHPVLRRPAEPVADPGAPEVKRLIVDMWETLADVGGIGLAAPQVHVGRRIVIFFVPAERAAREDEVEVPPTVLINPEITPLTDATVEGWEACLSVPGLTGWVPRYQRIRYRALTPQGQVLEREASGFHARVVQHECDHLDGTLYPMRMTDMSKLMFVEEMQRSYGDDAIPEE